MIPSNFHFKLDKSQAELLDLCVCAVTNCITIIINVINIITLITYILLHIITQLWARAGAQHPIPARIVIQISVQAGRDLSQAN